MGVRRKFSRGSNVDIILILFRLLTMQCKWTFTKRVTRSSLKRKYPMLRQQSQKTLFVGSNSQLYYFCLQQGCGAGTQISGSGFSSGHLNFLTTASTPRSFWLRLQNNLVQKIKTMYYLYNSLAPKTMSVEPEPKLQAPAPSSKNVCLRFRGAARMNPKRP